jgi:Na+-driven multidrug efflux pump
MIHEDAAATVPAIPQVAVGPTLRQMLSLWVPLAASMLIMVLETTIVNIGLGRSADAELALAAYGVAYSIALLVEAPILMLIDASVARSIDDQAFAAVRLFTVYLGLLVTAIGFLVSATPLYGLIVERLMGIPADVAAWARPCLIVLSFWSFPIGWRRSFQGVLIRAGRTAVITIATVARLAVLSAVLFAGLALWPEQGAVVAGIAMDISVLVEAILVTWAARRVLRAGRLETSGSGPRQPLTLGALWHFYAPLLVTSLIRQAIRPVLSAGIAAAAMARPSLAAWPVAWGLATLVAGPGWSLQQLTTALATDEPALKRVSQFSLGLSLGLAGLLVLVGFTPLYGVVMGGIYNLSPELQEVARPALCVMGFLPLVMGAQSLFRGLLIRHGATKTVRSASLANAAVLVVSLLAGLRVLPVTGALLAAATTMLSNLVELACLWWSSRR